VKLTTWIFELTKLKYEQFKLKQPISFTVQVISFTCISEFINDFRYLKKKLPLINNNNFHLTLKKYTIVIT